MTATNRYCVYVDWSTSRAGDDDALSSIGTDVIPDDESSETCIYWDEQRPGVLVISWNFDAADRQAAYDHARAAVEAAVGPVIPGHLDGVSVSLVDDGDD